jgi:cellulose synthase operon protein C
VTRDYAAYAVASGLMGDQRQEPRLPLPQLSRVDLSAAIHGAIAAGDGATLIPLLGEANSVQPGFGNQFLLALAHQAQVRPDARQALLSAVRDLEARPPFVQVLRRLFKYADLTDDGALFAASARRFELARPMYNARWVYNDRVWIAGQRQALSLSQEQASSSPRIALSEQTLLYFKRRAWRSLRKRGELGQDAFAAMATELLLAFSDADGERAYKENTSVYENGRYCRVEYYHGEFRRIWSLGQLLHRHSPVTRLKANTLSFTFVGTSEPGERGEAFPALWDAHPEHLLHIAAAARNRPSALFALAALKQRPGGTEALDVDVTGLLASPYDEVNAFGLGIATRLVEAGRADGALAAALVISSLREAQLLGARAIEAEPSWPWSDPGLALAVFTTPHGALHKEVRTWLEQRRPTSTQAASLTEALAAWLVGLPEELDGPQQRSVRFTRSLVPMLWSGHDCPLAPAIIQALTGHGSLDVQAAALDLLAVTAFGPAELPQSFWDAIMAATSPQVRAASMSLLARLDEAGLVRHDQTVLAAATSEHADLRAAARPLMARLAEQNGDFAASLRDRLMAVLFQAEPSEGYAADMVELFAASLRDALASFDTSTLWRLLQAKAKGARLLGSLALQQTDPARFSVRQIARLGNHAFAAVRRWAVQVLQDQEVRFRAEPEEAVLFVESEWDDVRIPATQRLMDWPAGSLPASALAVMADSAEPAVQESARQLLRRSLATEDAGAVLTRVLEHPSASFHLFVTELLTSEALEQPALFEKFLVQARIILFQINRGRIAKDRVMAALGREAVRDHDRARSVGGLLHDLTLSAVGKDRAPALLILRDIAQAWPDIGLPAGMALARPAGLPQAASHGSAA